MYRNPSDICIALRHIPDLSTNNISSGMHVKGIKLLFLNTTEIIVYNKPVSVMWFDVIILLLIRSQTFCFLVFKALLWLARMSLQSCV